MNMNDLQTGMKVVFDDGREGLVFRDVLNEWTPNGASCILENQPVTWHMLHKFDQDMTNQSRKIMEVYIPEHPYSISQFYGFDHGVSGGYGWKLYWKRNDRVEQIKADIKSHQDRIKELQAELELEELF